MKQVLTATFILPSGMGAYVAGNSYELLIERAPVDNRIEVYIYDKTTEKIKGVYRSEAAFHEHWTDIRDVRPAQ